MDGLRRSFKVAARVRIPLGVHANRLVRIGAGIIRWFGGSLGTAPIQPADEIRCDRR